MIGVPRMFNMGLFRGEMFLCIYSGLNSIRLIYPLQGYRYRPWGQGDQVAGKKLFSKETLCWASLNLNRLAESIPEDLGWQRQEKNK